MAKLGIVILNYNTPQDVLNCVKSIHYTYSGSCRIYIVDNHSTDDSLEILNRAYGTGGTQAQQVCLIAAPRNGGFSYGNNLGIRRAEADGCEEVLITNADILYQPGAIETMQRTLNRSEKIGAVGPSVLSPDGEETQLLMKPLTSERYLAGKKPLRWIGILKPYFTKEYPMPAGGHHLVRFYGMVRGCCFMMKTDFLREIGYLDENVFLYEEESILARKMMEHGKKTAVDFQAAVIHNESSSISKSGEAFSKYHHYLSNLYYLKEYANEGRVMLVMVWLVDSASFLGHALGSGAYRKLALSYLRQSIRLLLTGGNPGLDGNKITKY